MKKLKIVLLLVSIILIISTIWSALVFYGLNTVWFYDSDRKVIEVSIEIMPDGDGEYSIYIPAVEVGNGTVSMINNEFRMDRQLSSLNLSHISERGNALIITANGTIKLTYGWNGKRTDYIEKNIHYLGMFAGKNQTNSNMYWIFFNSTVVHGGNISIKMHQEIGRSYFNTTTLHASLTRGWGAYNTTYNGGAS
ncbi:MAG: hypothetical protein WC974_01330 [Thermoplasmata archaeon]